MSWADWLIIGLISISTLISLKRGFFKEAISLLIWVVAFMVARTFSHNLSSLLVEYIDAYSARMAVAFIILFVMTLVVGALINYLVATLVRATGLTGTDRVLGMVFGMARGALLVVVAVALVRHTPVSEDAWWKDSNLIPQFLLLEQWSFDLFLDLSNWLSNVRETL